MTDSALQPGSIVPIGRVGGYWSGATSVAVTVAIALGLNLACATDAHAEVEGRYQTKGQNIKVNIQSWGDDCGPRPRSASGGGGKVIEVRRVGSHLSIGGQRTDQCWSRNPRVHRVRAAAGTTSWTSVCETPAADPRFEHGEYTVELVNENTLRFREQSRYDWRLEGDHCKATVTLTRSYTRVSESPQAPEDTAPPPPEPPAKCRGSRGEPVKLDVRPARTHVGPGDRVCFRAIARDSEGCPVPSSATWSLHRTQGAEGAQLDTSGCFVAGVTPDASEGEATVTAEAGRLTAKAIVEVRLPDIGDLVAARLAEGTEAEDQNGGAALARPGAAQGVETTTVGPVRSDRGLLWTVVAGGIGAAALLLVAALLLWRRRRREIEMAELVDEGVGSSKVVASSVPPRPTASVKMCPTCKQEFSGNVDYCPDDATKLVAARGGEGRSGQSLICPTCRRGYEGGERFCSHCSEELVPYAVWRASQLEAQRSKGEAKGGMICPKCAARYDQGILFCQKDGTKLEPIN